MDIIIILFLVIATLFALATLGYTVWDVIVEKRQNEQSEEDDLKKPTEKPIEKTIEAVPIVTVIPEPEPEVFPEIVDQIDAEEADQMISDDLAMKKANFEHGAGVGRSYIINIGVLNKNFEAGSLITIQALKERGLISQKAGRIKVLAFGVLNKPFTVKAESYSIQAIKMIELTGGNVIILKD